MGNFAFIITFLSEFAVLAQNEGTGIFATFVAMYLIRYGLSTFFAVYLFIFIVKQFYEYLKGTSIRKNKRRFKRQLAASYKIQKKTIQENYEKGLTDTGKVKKNVYNKTKNFRCDNEGAEQMDIGIAIVNEGILILGAIGFLLWLIIFGLVLFSVLKRTRKKYSFDKGGAKVAPLVIALVLLVVLAGYMGVIVYQLSVVRI